MGNHEFDGGIDDFARMLAAARYPFVAANLDFSRVRLREGTPPIRAGRDGGSAEENAGRVVRSAWVRVGDQRVGVVGRAPADFFNVVSRPDQTVPGLDFVGGRDPATNAPRVPALGQVLEQVALLEAQGIDKIVLVDHAQDFTGDPLATSALRGIDVVITAGSTGFTARSRPTGPFNRLRPGDRALGEYPVRRTDRDGHPVLVVNSDQLYRYVGHLLVGFDAAGRVVKVDPRSGPVATTPEAVADLARLTGRPVRPPAEVERLFGELTRTPLVGGLMRVVGRTRTDLNGERRDVRTRETNLGRVTAESVLWMARAREPATDLVVLNGGGFRTSIPGPQITGFTVAAALAFDNTHALVEVTAAQLLAALENGVSRWPAADGRFPQVAGLVLEFDPGRPGVADRPALAEPSRIRALRVERPGAGVDTVVEGFRLTGDPGRRFLVATNDFVAGGGDGYAAFKAAAAAGQRTVALPVRARAVFIQYVDRVLGGQVDLDDPVRPGRVTRAGS
jgi:2',3'-cyclic-nucleotide 2'-phosphodiesterase (5'-nucleotidase family)